MIFVNILPHKICTQCHRRKPVSYFNKYKHDALRNVCKKCVQGNNRRLGAGYKAFNTGDVPLFKKICARCKREKTSHDFHRDRSKKNGLTAYCKICAIRNSSRIYRENQKSENNRHYKSYLMKTYGITLERKAEMLVEQGGCCAACGSLDNQDWRGQWHVDHVHGSDPVIVRGLLCRPCNIALGCAKESKHRLESLIRYLDRHNCTVNVQEAELCPL